MNLEQAVNELVAKLREAMPDRRIEVGSLVRRFNVTFDGQLVAEAGEAHRALLTHELRFPTLYSRGAFAGDCVIKSRRFTFTERGDFPATIKHIVGAITAHVNKWLAAHAENEASLNQAKAELKRGVTLFRGATRVERFHTGLFDVHFIGPTDKIEADILAVADNIRARRSLQACAQQAETPTQAAPTTNVE